MSDALRALLRASPGVGELTGADVRVGRAEHPICGDEVELSVRWQADTVVDLAWRARGCPACVAVAAATREALLGVAADQLVGKLAARIDALGGLAPAERHALKLVQDALTRAR